VLAGTIQPHRGPRQELGIALPDASTRLLIYNEVAVRDAGGTWRTYAVGRSRTWVEDAPPSDMPHLARTLSVADSGAVDVILADPDLWRETSLPIGPWDHRRSITRCATSRCSPPAACDGEVREIPDSRC